MLAAFLILAVAGLAQGEVVEGWPVPAGTRIEVDALGATIRLTTPRAPAPNTSTRITSTLCRRESQLGRRLVMRCDSRLISANLVATNGRTQVMVRRLRAAPTVDGDATLPLFTWDPLAAGLGGPCPGDNDASRAECLLQRGDLVGAVAPLLQALADKPSYAGLRLGDLALLAGDPERAALFWDGTQGLGPFGRLAAARLCEIIGQCERAAALEAGIAFDPLDHAALPEVIADEMVLRRARAHAYQGRLDDVTAGLLAADMRPCRRATAFCQRVLLEAFRARGTNDAVAELTAWLALPARDGTTSSAELSSLAAAAARDIGAPGFAATVWSRAIDGKRGPALEQGMLQVTALYLDAGEAARAATVLRYAGKSFPRSRRQPQWQALQRRLTALDELEHRTGWRTEPGASSPSRARRADRAWPPPSEGGATQPSATRARPATGANLVGALGGGP